MRGIGGGLSIVECVCEPAVARERIARDVQNGSHPAQNRTPELFDVLRARAEPIEGPKLVVDTSRLAASALVQGLALE